MDKASIIVTSYVVLLLLFILVGIVKASFHFKYLKRIFPDKYKGYDSYLSVFTFGQYNVGLQFLILPFFKRYKLKEERIDAEIVKKVRLTQVVEILLLILILSPIILGIIMG